MFKVFPLRNEPLKQRAKTLKRLGAISRPTRVP